MLVSERTSTFHPSLLLNSSNFHLPFLLPQAANSQPTAQAARQGAGNLLGTHDRIVAAIWYECVVLRADFQRHPVAIDARQHIKPAANFLILHAVDHPRTPRP